MDDGLQELKTEELIPVAENQEEALAAEPAPAGPGLVGWLRLAYMLEFLLALTAVYTLWSEIGGQGHLDLLPWYTKLFCGVGLSWSIVRFSAGMVESEQFWNSRTRRWFLMILLFAMVMGGIVYYYHLHESPEEGDAGDTAATAAMKPQGGKISQQS